MHKSRFGCSVLKSVGLESEPPWKEPRTGNDFRELTFAPTASISMGLWHEREANSVFVTQLVCPIYSLSHTRIYTLLPIALPPPNLHFNLPPFLTCYMFSSFPLIIKTLIICCPHFLPHPWTLILWLLLPYIHPQLPGPRLLPLCFPSKPPLGWSPPPCLQSVNVDTQNRADLPHFK